MQKNYAKQIAGAILIAGLLIAGAILLRGNTAASPLKQDGNNDVATDIKLDPVSKDDHILGNPTAKVVIVEYTDSECPFCKRFHETMGSVIEQRGEKIAWVYRHYPIAQLHPKSFHESEAMECAWEQGGNEAFWKYTDELYARTESNNKLDVAELPKIAEDIGLDLNSFNSCLSGGKQKSRVQAYMDSGDKAGVSGTPISFILKNGKVVDIIGGAYPIETVLQKIDAALK
ncbi:DsbA family protein [Patescibacteria group bacterium]|nr:DsbA family protein [Patescibacteria group bacterium]MBU1728073.1 DsbA family protein [Patescibacteria group bacterium]